MNIHSRRVWGALLLTFLLALTACTKTEQAETPVKQSQEEALTSRVQARWDAMLELDMKRVYGFATPAYRQAHDLAHLKNQYAAQIQRTRIEIHEIQFDKEDPTTARVVVLLYFLTDAGRGVPYEGMSRVVETWVKRDGQWWYVEPR